MNIEDWRTYARCWSASDIDRASCLNPQVSDDVQYRDPNIEVRSRDELSSYMAGFQSAFPGHRFEIDSVAAHHNRSVARWRQVDGAGCVVWEGISFAAHGDDGRFRDITGFFVPAPK
jgi:predicted ester cyclase